MTVDKTDVAIIEAIEALESFFKIHPSGMGKHSVEPLIEASHNLTLHCDDAMKIRLNGFYDGTIQPTTLINDGITRQEICLIMTVTAIGRIVEVANLIDFFLAIEYAVGLVENARGGYLDDL